LSFEYPHLINASSRKSAIMIFLGPVLTAVRRVEETKGVIRIRISKKKRQHNGQKKKYKRTNNDLQHTTQWPKEKVQKDKQRSTNIEAKTLEPLADPVI